MCERCSLRQKAEIFVSPDMRLATAVLRQFWWGSVVGRDLVGVGGGVVTCLWVHWVWCLGNQGLIMFTGNAKSYLLNLVIVLLERHRNKCLIENVTVIASYFTVLLLINISELHLINNVHFSINSTELTSSPVFRFPLIKKKTTTMQVLDKYFISNLVNEYHVTTVTIQSLWITPLVSIPPNTKARFTVSEAVGLLACSSPPFPSPHTFQGNKHMEWSRRLGGISPSNFMRTHLHFSANRRFNTSVTQA